MKLSLRQVKNQQLDKPCIIISAELSQRNSVDNLFQTALLLQYIKDYNFRFKTMIGSYKGIKETSFLIMLDNIGDLKQLKSVAFNTFSQESILYIDRKRQAKLLFNDLTYQGIGEIKEITKSESLKLDTFTHDIKNDRYFYAG
jgi:hypothetical protein